MIRSRSLWKSLRYGCGASGYLRPTACSGIRRKWLSMKSESALFQALYSLVDGTLNLRTLLRSFQTFRQLLRLPRIAVFQEIGEQKLSLLLGHQRRRMLDQAVKNRL